MARVKKTKRGSPEAIAKRRAARALNQAFSEQAGPAMDGRTLKRKKRLVRELKEGRNGKPLKALDVLQHSDELLQLGESLSSIRKLKPKVPPTPAMTEDALATIREAQSNYGFDPRAWKVLGVEQSVVDGQPKAKRSTKKAAKKTSRKKTSRRSKRKTSRRKR